MCCSEQRIWGYETPWGSFAQFSKVQAQQVLPKPAHLTWEEAASYMLVLATAYRMLFGHRPHELRPGQWALDLGRLGRARVDGDPARTARGRALASP